MGFLSDPATILAQFDALLGQVAALGDPDLLDEMRRRFAARTDVVARPGATTPANGAAGPADTSWQGMIGECEALLSIRRQAHKFAAAKAPVLIRGESGTGKDILAQALHRIGPRAGQPFVSENCAAIPHSLLESVLFGHRRGAFTGAVRDHDGHFVAADKGTLFLDEIGDMPLPMQAKMLRALQEGEVRPVGGTKVQKVDVRIIAATNQDLEAMVRAGSFREDLYYRLNVLQLQLPPLRERGHDVVLLARALLAAASAAVGRVLRLSPDAEAALLRARWPGNVRQLQNEIQRLVALADGPELQAGDFSAEIF
jgi:two-component system NtrC family response regulator